MSDSAVPPASSSYSKTNFGVVFAIFIVGLLTWIGVSMFSSGEQMTSLFLVVFESLNNAWQNAFIASFFVVVVLTLVLAVIRNWPPSLSLKVVAYYGISPFLFLISRHIYNGIYFNQTINNEAAGLFGVIIIIFYILGLFLAIGCNSAKRADSLEAFFLLPLMGTLLLIVYTGWELFNSPEFIYRNAVTLDVKKVQVQDGMITADAVLKLNKEGDYTYSTDYYMDAMARDPNVPANKVDIVWDKKEAPKTPGEYPLHITAKNVPTNSSGFPSIPDTVTYRDRGPMLYLQISVNSQNGKKTAPLKMFVLSPSSPKNPIVQ